MGNCKKYESLQGPLEVFTSGAIHAFLHKETHCEDMKCCSKALHFPGRGEDFWMNECMNHIGANAMNDFDLLIDAYCGGKPSPCTNTWTAAFHPFKSTEKYFQCVHDAEPWLANNIEHS